MTSQLRWLVFGAGAIGTYIGGSLLLHGEKVVFLEQADSASILWEQGLKLNIAGQDYRILHPEVFSSITPALSFSTYDVIIFALKSFDTQAALDTMRPFAQNLPPVLCVQNGVENESVLAEILGDQRVIAGTVTSSVSRTGTGSIVLERKRGIGIASNHPLSRQIVRAFSESELNARLVSHPLAMKWSKMITNLLANASSAILDLTPAQILDNPHLYKVEITALQEALAVMQALHIPVIDLPGVPVRLFSLAVKKLPPAVSRPVISRIAGGGRGEKMPSFHIDLHSGRGRSEVDFLNGAVVRFGKQAGVPTPVNQWLNDTLLGMVRGELPVEEYSHQPEKLLRVLYLDQVTD